MFSLWFGLVAALVTFFIFDPKALTNPHSQLSQVDKTPPSPAAVVSAYLNRQDKEKTVALNRILYNVYDTVRTSFIKTDNLNNQASQAVETYSATNDYLPSNSLDENIVYWFTKLERKEKYSTFVLL